ncbi:MAG: translation initiation factor IF-2 [Bacteroidaceae bacterium]|nr:translation initiation factor IF-2 [Bacteroidaceae bacterium]
MGVRLNKAIKELNVGINTVAEFLQKKGMALEEATPNAKLTDEQYALLVSRFGADKDKNDMTRLDIQRRKEREEKERAERKRREQAEASAARKRQAKEIFHTKSENANKVELKIVGSIFKDDSKKPETAPAPEETASTAASKEPKMVAKPVPENAEVVAGNTETQTENNAVRSADEPKPAEAQAKPAHDSKPALSKEDVNQEKTPEKDSDAHEGQTASEVFKVEPPALSVTFKKVGFVDLSAINSKTRPDKKTKAEKKKEREEKDAARQEAKAKYKESVMKEIGTGNGNNSQKKKRQRINNGKVDINAAVANQKKDERKGNGNKPKDERRGNKDERRQQPQQQGGGKKNKKNAKVELTDEEVAKQVKETLARLTSKSVKSGVKHRKENRERHRLNAEAEENAVSKVLQLTEFVTANDLAVMMDISVTQVISTCMSLGLMVSINQRLDAETINIVAEEFGFETNYVSEEVTHAITEEEDAEDDLEPRAPVITVMGHVDHGKTSLLDYIRKANVIAGEAGGITQHIGAYNVRMANGKHITFLDTPGHEAFTAMRARGAKITDIAIIIIAADDDVMPQTKEAIAHAVAANVPMVFAINKIDKTGADPEKIKQQLSQMNYLVEDWGGKYQCQEISAKKGINVDELMEKVLLEAEMLDLKANPNRNATGSVVESSLDKGRGYVATVLVQNGTLHQGDIVLAGTAFGRIKAMFNERGQKIKQALPAEPALILGLNGAPTAGDTFHVMETEQEARELAHKRDQLKREQGIRTLKRVDLNELGRRIALGDFKELNLVVKGDVDGSIEALSDSLIKLSTDKIQVNVIHKAVGQISESDVTLAEASDAIIIGFQVRPSAAARRLAEQEGVDIRLYSVIYDTIEEIKSAMEGMLAPEIKEEVTANIEVRQVYNISKVGTVAGAFVVSGKVHRSDKIRVIRDGIVKHTGVINALKRFKDDVKEVSTNFDCGISITGYNDLREGDILETFEEIKIKQKL